jgi:hypothetical protein
MTRAKVYFILRILYLCLTCALFITLMCSTGPGQTYFQVFWKTFTLSILVVSAFLIVASLENNPLNF